MNRDLSYIEVAITAIQNVFSYAEDGQAFFSEETFLGNNMLRNAVLMHLVVVGEYVGKVSPKTQDSYPSPLWKDAKFARNYYIHQYDGIIWPYVYQTAATVLVPALEFLERVKEDLQNQENNVPHQ